MALADAAAHELDDGALHGALRGGVVGDGVRAVARVAPFLRHVGVASDVHGEREPGLLGPRPDGLVDLVEVGRVGGRGTRDAAAPETHLDDAVDLRSGGFRVLHGNRRETEQAAVRGGGVVVEPVVVVLLQGDQKRRIGHAEHGEEARIEELRGQSVGILILVPVGAVDQALAHAGVATVEERHQLRGPSCARHRACDRVCGSAARCGPVASPPSPCGRRSRLSCRGPGRRWRPPGRPRP